MENQSPFLIIVQGALGVGKSTIAHKLSKDLQIGLLSADDAKEFFFDTLGVGDADWSHALGASLKPYLYQLAKLSLSAGRSIIFESAFWSEYARKDMKELIDSTGCQAIELYCHTKEDVRLERFNKRIQEGSRHRGHSNDLNEVIDNSKYQPIDVCKRIDVDTTNSSDEELETLLNHIKNNFSLEIKNDKSN